MKVAIIDLGTNTFHLLLANLSLKAQQVFFKTQEPVKLGENMVKENKITPEAYERGLNCLLAYKKIMDEHQVDQCLAVATACVRTALNGRDFVEDVNQQTGIEIKVIEGEQEAQLIYEGVKWSGAITESALIMDIGGGSTEFMICNQSTLFWKKSYPIGASRLMQLFFHSDPISITDKKLLADYLNDVLKDLFFEADKHNIKCLIGSAGAFESFAAMTDLKVKSAFEQINIDKFNQLAMQLENSSHQERLKMKNLIPLRVDMIVMASFLTSLIIRTLQIEKIMISAYDLKMGVLKQRLDNLF